MRRATVTRDTGAGPPDGASGAGVATNDAEPNRQDPGTPQALRIASRCKRPRKGERPVDDRYPASFGEFDRLVRERPFGRGWWAA